MGVIYSPRWKPNINTNEKMRRTLFLYLMIIATALLALMTSCKSTKYHTCDAYKVQYPKLKPEKHKHHGLCDAYN